MSFKSDYENKQEGEYDCYDMSTGVVPTTKFSFQVQWEEPTPLVTYYKEQVCYYQVLFQRRAALLRQNQDVTEITTKLQDYASWRVGDVSLEQAFQDRDIAYRMSSPEWRLWTLLWQSPRKREEPVPTKVVTIRAFAYWFSTVDPNSLRLSPIPTGTELHKIGSEVYGFTYSPKLEDSVPYDDTMRDFLYEVEVRKATEYCTKTVLNNVPQDDWLYSLYMHVRHKTDRERILNLIPRGSSVISYGDRTASLAWKVTEYMDLMPSAYALAPVVVANKQKLATLVRGSKLLVLMYTYDLLSHEERLLIRKAQCPVIVWGSKSPPFPNNCQGVSVNFRALLPWLTDELKSQPEFPYSENFSMLAEHHFVDDGDCLRSLVVAGLYKKGVPVSKNFEPLRQYDVPLLRHSKGVMVVHSFTTLIKVVHNNPYYLPLGRKVDRILSVTRPMRTYQRFHLYHFRNSSQFEREISSPLFRPVYKEGGESAGFFTDVGESPGISITESTLGGQEVWARAYPLGFIVETRRKVYNFSLDHSSFEEAFTDMSSSERSSLLDLLENSPTCVALKIAWRKKMENT